MQMLDGKSCDGYLGQEGTCPVYLQNRPPGIVPILILDQYRCHLMPTVVARIRSIGFDIYYIPDGCTSLCQPVEIGYNQVLKTTLQQLWFDWLCGVLENDQQEIEAPYQELLSNWSMFTVQQGTNLFMIG